MTNQDILTFSAESCDKDPYRALACYVIIQCAKDCNSQDESIKRNAINDVKQGRLKLFLDYIGLEITPEQFLKQVGRQRRRLYVNPAKYINMLRKEGEQI